MSDPSPGQALPLGLTVALVGMVGTLIVLGAIALFIVLLRRLLPEKAPPDDGGG